MALGENSGRVYSLAVGGGNGQPGRVRKVETKLETCPITERLLEILGKQNHHLLSVMLRDCLQQAYDEARGIVSAEPQEPIRIAVDPQADFVRALR